MSLACLNTGKFPPLAVRAKYSMVMENEESAVFALALLFILLFLAGTSASAEIYKWTDDNGEVIYSDNNPGVNSKIITVKEPGSIKAQRKLTPEQGGSDIEYALNIRKLNSEYGTNMPKELCENKNKYPCKMPFNLLVQPISHIDEAKRNLTSSAWHALRKYSGEGKPTADKATWEFNLCQEKWNNNEPCVPVNGYIVINRGSVLFYTFFIKGISADPERVTN